MIGQALAQIDGLNLGVASDLLRLSLGDQPAVGQNEDSVRVAENDVHVMLGEEDAKIARPRDLGG